MKTVFLPDLSFSRLSEIQFFSRSNLSIFYYIVFVERCGPDSGCITFVINESFWEEAKNLLDGFISSYKFCSNVKV